MKDDELLNFDRSRLAHAEETDFAGLLVEHGDLYRNHLAIAKWIDRWREGMEGGMIEPSEFQDGFRRGIADIAAHLRQGDLLPDGILLTQGF